MMKKSLRTTVLGLTFLGFLSFALLLSSYFVTELFEQSIQYSNNTVTLLLERHRVQIHSIFNEIEQKFQALEPIREKYEYALVFQNFQEVSDALNDSRKLPLQSSHLLPFSDLLVVYPDGNIQLSSTDNQSLFQGRKKFPIWNSIPRDIGITWHEGLQTYIYSSGIFVESKLTAFLIGVLSPEVLNFARDSMKNDLEKNGFEDCDAWLVHSKFRMVENPSSIEKVDFSQFNALSFHKVGTTYLESKILNFPGNTQAHLGVSIPESIILKPIYRSIGISLSLTLVIFLLWSFFQSLAFLKLFVRPLQVLKQGADQMAAGIMEQSIQITSENEIGDLANSFNFMSKSILTAQTHLQEFNEKLALLVQQKTASIQNLLDHTGQGFFSFDINFQVQEEFSRECLDIFGEDFCAGVFIQTCLFEDDQERKTFTNWMKHLFEGTITLEVIQNLAPKSIQKNSRIYSIEYQLIPTGTEQNENLVMMILTDISERTQLESQIKEEQAYARMLLRVLEFPDQFTSLIHETDQFPNFCEKLLSPDLSKHDLDYCLRYLHTLKGTLGYFEFSELTECVHNLETYLQSVTSDFRLKIDSPTVYSHSDHFFTSLNRLKRLIKSSLKDAVSFEERLIRIPESVYLETLEALKTNHSLYSSLVKFGMKPLKSLLRHFPPIVQELGLKQGKTMNEVRIQGGEFLVNPEKFEPIQKNLIHAFRNAIDHGIEFPLDRESANKDPFGTIGIELEEEGDQIQIIIEDDGAGIDPEKIQVKMKERNLHLPKSEDQMQDQDWIECVFLPGFSTASEISEISGRGVGMDALKAGVEEVGGQINLQSALKEGTTLIIQIPKQSLI